MRLWKRTRWAELVRKAHPTDMILGWRLEAGGWRLEAGGWRLEAGAKPPNRLVLEKDI